MSHTGIPATQVSRQHARMSAAAHLSNSQWQVQSAGGEAQAGGEREGDAEPQDAACIMGKRAVGGGTCQLRDTECWVTRRCMWQRHLELVGEMHEMQRNVFLTQDVALVGGGGARGDSGLPVSLIHENCTKVAH